MIHCIMIGVN